MLEVSFCCPLCSRIFSKLDRLEGPIPAHLDLLLGQPCQGAGRTLTSWLEVSERALHASAWPISEPTSDP